MIRMPPYLDNCTSRFARTSRCDGHAIYYHRAPITRRFFYALCRWGWLVIFLAALALTGCADHSAEHAQAKELEAAQQDAAALASREFAGQQVCGPAAEAIWIDDKTLTCQPKRGQAYSVAGVKP